MERILRSLSTKSETAGAIRYALSHWHALTRYVHDGLLEIDNSTAERELLPSDGKITSLLELTPWPTSGIVLQPHRDKCPLKNKPTVVGLSIQSRWELRMLTRNKAARFDVTCR
jgi:hypothetical protein